VKAAAFFSAGRRPGSDESTGLSSGCARPRLRPSPFAARSDRFSRSSIAGLRPSRVPAGHPPPPPLTTSMSLGCGFRRRGRGTGTSAPPPVSRNASRP